MMITQQRLKEILDYNPNTGVFTWKKVLGRRCAIGEKAGTVSKRHGYEIIQINSKLYKAHRLAWLYYYGCWPSKHIDHINGQRNDNRIVNLRDVERIINNSNAKKRLDNKSGKTGVLWSKAHQKWSANIQSNKKRIFLGLFDDYDEAVKARERAELIYQPLRTVKC